MSKRELLMRTRLLLAALLCVPGIVAAQEKPAQEPAKPAAKPAPKAEPAKAAPSETKKPDAATEASLLDLKMPDIDGTEVPLSKYKGKAILIVNVASKCGLTPQYEQLQKLHEKYGSQGLAILAFPANNFGGQEPGTNGDIKSFCKTKFNVSFDLFSKISVAGDDCHELYKRLTAESNGKLGGPIKWNFTKFLVDRDGKLVERFEPRTKPDAEEVTQAIEKTLAAKSDKKE
jgi:glutathione peroxidase